MNIFCNAQLQKGEFVIKNEGNNFFLALQGDLLILDSGTGPDYRDLKIWNLKSRTKGYTGQYLEILEIRPESIALWRETSINASPKNCPKLEEWKGYGLAAAIDRLVELRFSDFEITETSRLRCSSRQ